MRCHRIFGFTVASELDFLTPLPPADSPPDLTLSASDEQLSPRNGSPDAVFLGSCHAPNDELCFSVYALGRQYLLSFPGEGDFLIGAREVRAFLPAAPDREGMEFHLLGSVLSMWLECSGRPVLHGAGVCVDGSAAGFLGASGMGKSSLLAACIEAQIPLLTDDLIPIERSGGVFAARPSYPQIRLWTAAVRRFLPEGRPLRRLHPDVEKYLVPLGPDGYGSFQDEPAALACLYLLERGEPENGTGVEITPLPSREALIELVRHSYLGTVVEALGFQPARLQLLAQVARQVPVCRVRYPSGFEILPRVRDAILRDLDRR